jgi:hypothetical protein
VAGPARPPRPRPTGPTPKDRPLTALPSPLARAVAFGAILVAGVFGGLIGYAFVDIQRAAKAGTPEGIGAVIGALFAAGGTAVLAVLALRAMGEWRTISQDPPSGSARRPPGDRRPPP